MLRVSSSNLNPEELQLGIVQSFRMAYQQSRKICKITCKEEFFKTSEIDSKIRDVIKEELKEKKETLKMNSVNFKRHFENNLPKMKRRKERINIRSKVVSTCIILNLN